MATPPTNRDTRPQPNQDAHSRRHGPRTVTAAEKAQAREVSLRRIGRLFAPYKWQLTVVTAIIVASSLVGLASPFLLRAVIDKALPERDVQLLAWLVIAMVAVAAVTSGLGVIQTWISTKIGQHVMHGLRTSVFTHLQRQSIAFFTRTRTGEVQSRIQNDIGGMEVGRDLDRHLHRLQPHHRGGHRPSPWSPCPGGCRSSRWWSCRRPST